MYYPESNVYDHYGAHVLRRMGNIVRHLDMQEIEQFKYDILTAHRLFVIGSGRSGLVGRFFAMRLMHMGIEVYVVGETNTPRIHENDLLIAISGSGSTPSVVRAAERTKETGAKVIAITVNMGNQISTLSACADYTIPLERRQFPPQERWAFNLNENQKKVSLLPMGSLFELGALLFLETVVCALIEEHQIPEDEMKSRHTILE